MPFQPGHTLSQGPKSKPITEAMIRVLKQNPEKLKKAIEAQLDRASQGDLASLAWLTERMEGKPKGDDGEKGQLIQVFINGYAEVQARIVDNSHVHDHDPPMAVTGGLEAVGGVASREPDDSLPTPVISENLVTDTSPSESGPPGINSVQELEVVPSIGG